jgi:putative aldouronate transport system substrate-binding protein
VVTLSALTNAFGLPQYGSTKDGIPEDWIDAQGKLHFGPISDEYKHYLQYMNQLYEAKVLDPDLISNSATIFQQKMVQGQVGVVAMFSPQQNMFEGRAWYESLKKADPNAEWVYLSPVKGPNGYYGNNADAQSSVFSIAMTKNVLKEPGKAKKVMELLAYMYNDGYAGGKGGRFIDFGAEGIHHQTGSGRIKQLLPQLSNDQNNYLLAYSMGGVLNHRDVTKLQATESEYELSEKIDADKSKNNRIVNYFYDSLPFEYNGDNYIKDASMKFIYGKEEFSEWEDYVRTLNEQYQYAQVQQIRLKELKQKGLLK